MTCDPRRETRLHILIATTDRPRAPDPRTSDPRTELWTFYPPRYPAQGSQGPRHPVLAGAVVDLDLEPARRSTTTMASTRLKQLMIPTPLRDEGDRRARRGISRR